MTKKQQRELATRIAKESDFVTVKFGETNGRLCLHLKVDRPSARVERVEQDSFFVPRLAASETIYGTVEWDYHPWNKTAKSRDERSFDRDLMDAVRNQEAQ